MPASALRLGNIFTQARSSPPDGSQLETEPSSPTLTLPPYTVEPFTRIERPNLSNHRQDSASDISGPTLAAQMQQLHSTLDPSNWPRHGDNPQTPGSAAQFISSNQAVESPNAGEASGSGSASLEQSILRASTVQRSKFISDALEAGEDVCTLHRKTTHPNGEKGDPPVQIRLQNVYIGQLVLKIITFIRSVRKSQTISDKTERNYLDRALQLCLKLQNKQMGLTAFWNSMVLIVGDLQNMLSKHHLDIGIEEIVTHISDIENRIAMRNITQ